MNLGKVIFIDSVHGILWERLTKSGWICEDFTKTELAEIFDKLHEYSGIVIRSRFQLHEEILSNFIRDFQKYLDVSTKNEKRNLI